MAYSSEVTFDQKLPEEQWNVKNVVCKIEKNVKTSFTLKTRFKLSEQL